MKRRPNPVPTNAVAVPAEDGDLLDLEPSQGLPLAGSGPWVAMCVDARHPSLVGRICVAVERRGTETVELWVPTLHGLAVRAGDQVLLSKPENWIEPVAVGVVDGFARRPERQLSPAATVTVARDECLRVEGQEGQALVEIRQEDAGPVLRLLDHDVHLEVPGELRVTAKSIALTATQGEARIDADGDVVVGGETIQLN